MNGVKTELFVTGKHDILNGDNSQVGDYLKEKFF